MLPNHVRVQISNPSASGRREGWWKQVTAVDPAGTNGYAIHGDFLKEGYHDLPIGAVLVRQAPGGSVKNWTKDGKVFTVTADGIKPFSDDEWSWTKSFVFLRDELIAALAAARAAEPPAPADPAGVIDMPARIAHWTQKFRDDPSLADDVAEVLLSVDPARQGEPFFIILAAALNRFRS
jgi:hypothetical protein